MTCQNHWRMPFRANKGMIFGVCRGLAEHFNLSVFWFRFFAVLVLIFTGLWPLAGIYLVLALLMHKAPPDIPAAAIADSAAEKGVQDHAARAAARERDWDRRLYGGV